MENKTWHNIHQIISGNLSISLVLTFCLNMVLLIKCIGNLYLIFKKHQTCKRTPNLHPIHKDVQYLSQQRKLYNQKTHLVKYALIVLCISIELLGILWFTITSLIMNKLRINSKDNRTLAKIENAKFSCSFRYSSTYRFYNYPYLTIVININYFLISLLFVSLSLLTRYLAARYVNHPFRAIFIKYLAWLGVQSLIISVCSTDYTLPLEILLFPLLSIVNWLVLLRDNRLLCRVLKSNLREIELFGNNKTLYKEQLFAFRFYRVFQKLLLLSLFFVSILCIFYQIFLLYSFILDINCNLNAVYAFNISINTQFLQDTQDTTWLHHFGTPIVFFFYYLYSLSNLFPLMFITFLPCIYGCFKRYKYRNIVYRYNYHNLQPLLRRRQ